MGRMNNGKCNLDCNTTMCAYDGGDCLPKDGKNVTRFEQSEKWAGTWRTSLAFGNGILNTRYGVAKRWYTDHVPYLVDRTICQDYIKSFPLLAERTIAEKFRTSTNLNFPFMYFNFLMSESDSMRKSSKKPGRKDRYNYKIRQSRKEGYGMWIPVSLDSAKVKAILKRWLVRKPPFAFLQDSTKDVDEITKDTKTFKVLHKYMLRMYPYRSQFEKDNF